MPIRPQRAQANAVHPAPVRRSFFRLVRNATRIATLSILLGGVGVPMRETADTPTPPKGGRQYTCKRWFVLSGRLLTQMVRIGGDGRFLLHRLDGAGSPCADFGNCHCRGIALPNTIAGEDRPRS